MFMFRCKLLTHYISHVNIKKNDGLLHVRRSSYRAYTLTYLNPQTAFKPFDAVIISHMFSLCKAHNKKQLRRSQI